MRNPNGRLARWALELQAYDCQIEHRKGSLNLVPDALSRMYEEENPDQIASINPVRLETKNRWYKRMFARVQSDPTQLPDWKIIGGNLYHYRPDPTIEDILEDQEAWKLVPTPEKRRDILHEAHNEPTAGHLGRRKTYERVARYYYWREIYKDVQEYVRNCATCQQIKVEQLRPSGLMGRRIMRTPWEMVAADIMGPFPRSTQGYNYLLIFLDTFTRWIEVIPIRKADGKTIKRELRERVFLRFGIPGIFLSDNGTEFRNKLLDNYLKEYGVEHHTIPPYHAQANPVERVNRTFKTMLTSFIEKEHKFWDKYVPELTFAYNTAIQDSTGVSPAFLNFGRHPTPPHCVRTQEERSAQEQLVQEAITKWQERMCQLFHLRELAARNAQKASDRQATYYNAKRRPNDFAIGDEVWKRNRILSSAIQGINAKLAPKFAGPYRISAKLGSNVYELMDENDQIIGKSHIEDLKPYHREADSEEEETEENRSTEDQPGTLGNASTNDTAKIRGDAQVSLEAPRPRVGRVRKTRVIVNRKTITVERKARVQATVPGNQTVTSDTAEPKPTNKRGRPKGSRNAPPPQISLSPRRTRSNPKTKPSSL